MRLNILFGGQAGQGPNILTHVLAEALVKQGYYVFYSRDYQSLIRGGHNFNVLTVSDKPTHSNDSKINIIIALDENTEKLHKKDLAQGGIILSGKNPNMYFAGKLFKILGLDFKLLDEQLKKLKRYEDNSKAAKQGYEESKAEIKLPTPKSVPRDIFKKMSTRGKSHILQNGSQTIAQGAIKSGLDLYYAYPMTPATTVLNELAQAAVKGNFKTMELENEIAVVNAGVGSAITGAKTMVGTSGGGFDLMTEGLSLCGVAGVPLVFYLSQRPGPGTGVATYTAQGDLKMALNAGHGEFNRIVLAPGTPEEAEELTNQAFYLSQKFQTPSIIISDKHLGESFYSVTEKADVIKVPSLTKFGRYNSYEVDAIGSATEDAEIVKRNIEARLKVKEQIAKEASKFKQYKIYGKKNSKNIIVAWGSTKGAILDAVKDLDVCYLQILYMKPFPDIKKLLEGKKVILVENNATGQLGDLIKEKTGVEIKEKILRFDGRPFLADELREEIRGRLR